MSTVERSITNSTSKIIALAVGLAATLIEAKPVSAQQPPTDQLRVWLDANHKPSLEVSDQASQTVKQWENRAPGYSEILSNSNPQARPMLTNGPHDRQALRFQAESETKGDMLGPAHLNADPEQITVFVVAAPNSNPGKWRALLSATKSGAQDYETGFNLDLSQQSSNQFNRINVEGAKGGGGGGVDLMKTSYPFGTFHALQVNYYNNQVTLSVDGKQQQSRDSGNQTVHLDELRIGCRHYTWPGKPFERGYFDGRIAEVLIYTAKLNQKEVAEVNNYLSDKYGLDMAPSTEHQQNPSRKL